MSSNIFQNLVPTFIFILFILFLIFFSILFIYFLRTYPNRIHIINHNQNQNQNQNQNIDEINDENIIYQNNI